MENSESHKNKGQSNSEQEKFEQVKEELLRVSERLLNHPNLTEESKARLKEAGIGNFIFKE